MKPNSLISCGALLAGLSVAAGAFGAHGLKSQYKTELSQSADDPNRQHAEWRLAIFDTAARYHMYHAIAIIATGLVAARCRTPCSACAAVLFVAGIAVFSGCLYAMALGGPRELGRVVPFGGGAFIAGWICLAISALKSGRDSDVPPNGGVLDR